MTFKRIFSPNISESTRFCWTLGSQERRVLCFEKGTLFPDSFVLPWKRPSWERLKGLETTSQRALLGNMANTEHSSCSYVNFVKIVRRNKYLWLLASKANAMCAHSGLQTIVLFGNTVYSSQSLLIRLNSYAAMEGLLLLKTWPWHQDLTPLCCILAPQLAQHKTLGRLSSFVHSFIKTKTRTRCISLYSRNTHW